MLNHASNVTGGLLPVAEAGRIARKHGLLLLVDTAQSAGAVPIDMLAENIDLLAFTGHKSLLGPTGTGGLILGERVADDAIQPLILGVPAAAQKKSCSLSSCPTGWRAAPLTPLAWPV